ncbi:speckle targeted PIP5K1A-regulated poly(A) polymerase-like [Sycon ciliatum]|uniref:speckle targeted PIP5K1A-regulated poly(A) polymerase-like n=1 Tax=Sycon ciliatum TaxID=27933 RepID=UPI0031F6E666
MASNEGDPCWCSLCSIRVPGAHEMSKHVEGKKHVRMMASSEARLRHEKQSVFVRNFPAGTDEKQLGAVFAAMGHVEKIIFDKNSDAPKFAIVEFSSEQAVEKVLGHPEPFLLKERRLVVKARNSKTAEKSTPKKAPDTAPSRAKADASKTKAEKMDDGGPSSSATEESLDPAIQQLNAAPSMEEQFRCLVNLQSPNDDDMRKRQELAGKVRDALQTHAYASNSDVAVQLYGSATSGFGLRSSDVDMTLVTAGSAPEQEKVAEVTMLDELDKAKLSSTDSSFSSLADSSAVSHASLQTLGQSSADEVAAADKVKEQLEAIASVIRHHVAGCGRVFTIPKARRPVVRFYNSDLKLQCDLTLNNKLAIENSRLLQQYAKSDHRVLPLAHAVRVWACSHSLSGTSSSLLSGYSLALLVIAFLQRTQPPVLPCLQQAPSTAGQPATSRHTLSPSVIDGWHCSVFDGHQPGVNFSSVDQLLHDFFVYYGSFDFETNAVAIHVPSTVSISDVLLVSAQRVDDYSSCNGVAGNNHLARLSVFRQSSMCIQDPFEVTHNVNAGAGPPLLRHFVDQCRSTALLCQTDWLKQPHSSTADGTSSDGSSSEQPASNWGLSQIIAPPAGPGVRFLSISLTADQISAHLSKTQSSTSSTTSAPPAHSKKRVLNSICDLMVVDFGFKTTLQQVELDGCNDVDDTSDSEENEKTEQSSDEDDNAAGDFRSLPGKVKKSLGGGAAAKRTRHASEQATSDGLGQAKNCVQAYCEARENTWLHRRRWRREMQRRRAAADRGNTAEITDQLTSVSTPLVLAFQLHVLKARSAGSCMYSIVFQPTETKFMNELHVFVAVLRKDLIQKTSA